MGPDGKPRWTLTGLQGPSDAQVLANQHVLVAEQGRVTERDLSGNVLWKLEGIQPLSVQRLANGNTFIPCNGLLVEVDRAGKDILRVPVRQGSSRPADCLTGGSSPSTSEVSSSWTRPDERSSEFQ